MPEFMKVVPKVAVETSEEQKARATKFQALEQLKAHREKALADTEPEEQEGSSRLAKLEAEMQSLETPPEPPKAAASSVSASAPSTSGAEGSVAASAPTAASTEAVGTGSIAQVCKHSEDLRTLTCLSELLQNASRRQARPWLSAFELQSRTWGCWGLQVAQSHLGGV